MGEDSCEESYKRAGDEWGWHFRLVRVYTEHPRVAGPAAATFRVRARPLRALRVRHQGFPQTARLDRSLPAALPLLAMPTRRRIRVLHRVHDVAGNLYLARQRLAVLSDFSTRPHSALRPMTGSTCGTLPHSRTATRLRRHPCGLARAPASAGLLALRRRPFGARAR